MNDDKQQTNGALSQVSRAADEQIDDSELRVAVDMDSREEGSKDTNESQEQEKGAGAARGAEEVATQETARATGDKAEEYLHGWRRAKADYENLKKEVDRERKEMGVFARVMAAMDFIPIYDNFKKAAAHEPELSENEESKRFQQWMDGIQLIKSQFKEVLKQMGIEEISSVGASFDPRVHEAVEEREMSGAPPGQIIAEVSGGYKMGERVLQAAKVIIAK